MKKLHKLSIFVLGFLVGLSFLFLIQGVFAYFLQYQRVDVNVDSILSAVHESLYGTQDSSDQKYDQFDQVFSILQSDYYDPLQISGVVMRQQALKSFVNAIEDPYTVYLDAEENLGLQEMLQGEEDFEGIGAVVAKKDEGVLVQEVLKGSPAFAAGVKPFDVIVKVDDVDVVSLSLVEAIEYIRGPKGSDVVLTIVRTDKKKNHSIITITVTRDSINVPSVTSKVIEKGGKQYGYIAISIVGEETEEILRKEISSLKSEDIKGLVLDLRGNGGGLLSTAVAIVSHFVPSGELVVSAKYRTMSDEEFFSQGSKDFGDLPISVLMDGMTASAGEIIAMALRDIIGAKLVGTTSFGKGSIQTIQDLDDGSSLKYTVGKRFGPKGETIDQIGITPDVEVEFDEDLFLSEGKDLQLEKAIEILS